jgi:hypothetical protein
MVERFFHCRPNDKEARGFIFLCGVRRRREEWTAMCDQWGRLVPPHVQLLRSWDMDLPRMLHEGLLLAKRGATRVLYMVGRDAHVVDRLERKGTLDEWCDLLSQLAACIHLLSTHECTDADVLRADPTRIAHVIGSSVACDRSSAQRCDPAAFVRMKLTGALRTQSGPFVRVVVCEKDRARTMLAISTVCMHVVDRKEDIREMDVLRDEGVTDRAVLLCSAQDAEDDAPILVACPHVLQCRLDVHAHRVVFCTDESHTPVDGWVRFLRHMFFLNICDCIAQSELPTSEVRDLTQRRIDLIERLLRIHRGACRG